MNYDQLTAMSVDEIGKALSATQPGSLNHGWLLAELNRRQLLDQIRSTTAQADAAKAALDTVEYTKKNARYMLWSVIVLAISGVVSTVVTLTLAFAHH